MLVFSSVQMASKASLVFSQIDYILIGAGSFYEAQVSLELTYGCSLASASRVLGINMCATTPASKFPCFL